MEITQKKNEIFVCQKKYAKKILKKFQFDECKVMNTPMNQKEKFIKEDGADKVDEAHFKSLIGCLMYITSTRSDVLFPVSLLSRFMHCASELHLKVAKRVVRYIKGTGNYGVKYCRLQDIKLSGSLDGIKSTSRNCFNMGSSVFSCCTKKQEVVAQSIAEAEFVVATVAINQAIWLRNILTKHFNVKLFYLREVQENGDVQIFEEEARSLQPPRSLDLGKEVHLYLMLHGFDHDVYIRSSLIDMYAKCGSINRSLLVFYKLQNKNLFCWNYIIKVLATHGHAEGALRMFGEMERKRIQPNTVTFISILSACTHTRFIEDGRRSKAGLLEDALEMVRNMTLEPNSFIWSALLNGCKLHKNNLMTLEPSNSRHYSLLVNMYAEVYSWSEVAKVQTTMKDLGVEINKRIHLVSASDIYHPSYSQVHLLLAELDD
ncbi:Pentatricopeptide repeat-containing protein, partial [Mucuna pruriens]